MDGKLQLPIDLQGERRYWIMKEEADRVQLGENALLITHSDQSPI